MSPIGSALRRLIDGVAQTPDGGRVTLELSEPISELIANAPDVQVTRHPLGFYHFELTPLFGDVGRRVRLHIWTERSLAERDDLGTLHAHTWHLASCVLIGELIDASYDVVSDPEGEFTEFVVAYDQGSIDPTGASYTLHPIRVRKVCEGEVYCLADGVVHSTDVVTVPAATLVVARETDRRHTSVYARRGDQQRRSTAREQVSPGEGRAVIQAVFQ